MQNAPQGAFCFALQLDRSDAARTEAAGGLDENTSAGYQARILAGRYL
jgi:hypothetical protein